VALAVWSYLAYPPLLRRLAARRSARDEIAPRAPVGPPPSVEVLVAASDEEAVIADRVRNLLAQAVPGPLRVSIGCDGSADATAARAREVGDPRAAVTEFPERRGKASVLNDLVAASRADVLVFTDANTRFEPGAIDALCRAAAPGDVGAACGMLILEASDDETPETQFWDRETEMKELEGRLGLCLGANGAIYAAKRRLVAPLPADTTSMDDFLIPLGVLRRGARVVFTRDAVAREAAARNAFAEMSRRFRIGVGAGQVLRRELWVWNVRRRPFLALIFFSRKAARWLAPLLVLASAVVALGSPALRWVGAAVLLFSLLLWRFPFRLGRAHGLGVRPYYFAVINLSLACGVAAGLVGYSRAAWKPQR